MAVSAHLAVAVEVVEQDVIAGELMVIRRNCFPIHRQVRISISRRLAVCIPEITHHLIVSAVFLDDIKHIFDWACVSDFGGDYRVGGK